MKPKLRRDTNTITIANFWENFLLSKYNFSPPYQRRSVWTDDKQSFFIDSILRNFPMPPIFLQQKIDNATGKTNYALIDGKQRLNALIRFIRNEIPCSTELTGDENDDEIAGKYFKDFDEPELAEYKSHFWRYSIPIEYIDTDSAKLIDNIFDRLNRNGEPLTGQELRNAQYHDTAFNVLVLKKTLTPFWRDLLQNLDLSRMEDAEFIAETFFVLLENGPQHANIEETDRLYEKYCNGIITVTLEDQFDRVTQFLSDLNLDFDGFRIKGPSHLYGLWCFAHYCVSHNILPNVVSSKLVEFFTLLRSRDHNTYTDIYRTSMSSRTKEKTPRTRRLEALLDFCQLDR